MNPILHEMASGLFGAPAATANVVNADALATATVSIWHRLPTLILGIEYELQIDLNLNEIRTHIDVLSAGLRNSEARAHLSWIKMIFDSYQQHCVSEIS